MSTRGLKDNSFKRIFEQPELFADFLRDFLSPKIPLFKDIKPDDTED
ncbi:MAG: hypothetical protein LBD73_08225 [Deferribacteraceae bacterium]|jgi:hypothetical protein|nr:hypothetical protein [Deferribacteraceae bacterium]